MGAAAFEAYLEPRGAEGFEEVTLNGTRVTYTSRAFLEQQFDAVLRLRVLRATGLREANVSGMPSGCLCFGACVSQHTTPRPHTRTATHKHQNNS